MAKLRPFYDKTRFKNSLDAATVVTGLVKSYAAGVQSLSVADGGVTGSKLLIDGSLTDGKFLRWNGAQNKFDFAALTDAAPFIWNGIGGSATNGFVAGGHVGKNSIDKFSLSSNTTAASWNTLDTAVGFTGGASSSTTGFVCKGYSATNIIQKFLFATSAASTSHGTLGSSDYAGCTSYSTTQGFYVSGSSYTTNIDKYDFSANTTGQSHGSVNTGAPQTQGHCSDVMGYRAGGYATNTFVSSIEKYNFSSNTTASTHGNLYYVSGDTASCSSTTQGFTMGAGSGGGLTASQSSMSKFDFSSNTTGTQHGSLTYSAYAPSGMSGATQGYCAGGYSATATINQFNYSSNTTANGIQTFIAGNSAYMKLYITAPENIIENVSSQISIKCGNVNLTDTNIIKGSLIKTTQGNRYTVTSIASPYVTTTPVITGRETIVSITDGEFYSVSGSDYGYKLNKVGTAMVTGSPAWILPRPYTSINFNNPSGLQSVSITDSLGSNAYSIDGTDNIIVGVVEYNQYCTEGIDYIKFLNIGRSAWTSAVSVSGTQGTFGVDIQLLSDGSFSYTSSNPTVIISQFGILYTFKRNSTSAYLSFGYLSTTHNGVGVALTVDNGSLNTYWVDPTVGASSAVSVNNYTANTVTNSTDSFALSISSTGVTKLINTTTGKVSISPYTYPYKIITSTVWKPTSTMTSQNKLDLSVYSYNFYNYGDLISLLKAYYVSNPSVIEYNDQSLYKLDQSTGGITPANLFSLPNAPNINKPLSFVIGLLSKNANNNAPSVWNLRAVTDSTHTLLKQNLMQYRFNSGAGTVDVTNNSGTDLNNVKVIVM